MKKLITLLCVMMMGMAVLADECGCPEQIMCYEHMFCEKGALSDMVAITNLRNIICKGNAFTVKFNCKFKSECAKAGDRINFECLVLPDGTAVEMSARPCTKDNSLKEDGWHTAGKLAASTVGLGIAGAGAGTGFAFISHPARLATGFAVGIPVGCAVGLITGLVTPGLKYHAKDGEEVSIILCEDLPLEKQCR